MVWLRKTLAALDIRDAHIYGGLVLAMLAGWQVVGWWSVVGLGVALAAIGIFAPEA